MVKLNNDWDELLRGQFAEPYYQRLRRFLVQEYARKKIYPGQNDIYAALRYTSYADTKVVILGQDPYHGAGQAHGLAFSVPGGIEIPPSLLNIYKELQSDLNCYIPDNGDLTPWAKQGVLLLNTTLTVAAGSPTSHTGQGWETLTDSIIRLLNDKPQPVVFLLWGSHAKAKGRLIWEPRHLVLTCAHPSPFSAQNGFFGCGHFSRANAFLEENGMTPIDWQIPNKNGE